MLAHDWLCGLRGGEHVLDRIAGVLADDGWETAGLYVMFDDRRPLTPRLDALPKVVSRIGRLPGASAFRRHLLPVYPACVADLSRRLEAAHRLHPIDLVISTSSAAIKGLRPPRGVPHVCYIHAPARYIWSRGPEYERGSFLRTLGLRLVRERFRVWDRSTASNVTAFIANSAYTQAQVRACYDRPSSVVHPPVRTDYFHVDPTVPRGDGWLVVSALEPYKRVDLAIEAANAARHPLTIIGDGSQRRRLRRRAGPTVTFAGRVDDGALRLAYQRARLLVFPQVEDFGIAAAEAQGCGTPVVAFREGGALDIVRDGTGAFFDAPTVRSLLDAIGRCPRACEAACRANAERFAGARFDAAIRGHIGSALPAQ